LLACGSDDLNYSKSSGISGASEPCSQIKKGETELYGASGLLPRAETEDSSRGLDHGIIVGSATSISGFDGKTIQRKVGKAQRNGNGPFKKLRMSQVDNLLPQAEADDTKMESDKLGSHLMKCSNAGAIPILILDMVYYAVLECKDLF